MNLENTSSELKMSMDSGHAMKMARMQFLVGLNESNNDCNDISIKESNEIKQLCYDNDTIENNPTRVVDFVDDGEVLYQNNMEMALNSLNKICAQANVNSIDCDDASGSSSSNSDSNNISISNIPTSSTCSKHPKMMIGNGDDNQVTNIRHRRSVEITAMTSVTTGIDGVPVISFSFHQTNDNAELSKDIPNENIDTNDKNGENSEVELELYDFPKSSRPTSVGDYIIRSNREDEEEEGDEEKGAVVIVKDKTTSLSSPVLNYSSNDDEVNQKYLNHLYDFPRSHKLSLLNKPDAIEHEKIDSEMYSNELKNNNECHYEMLNRSASLKLSKSDGCGLNLTVANLHSDSECPESRGRSKKYRLGKAWGKMRSWLREERTKLNEVVQRHARLQAVGVGCHSESNTDDDSMSSGRCGSYDLVAARAKELGIQPPQIHDNEFVLESVSEEIHLSQRDEVVVSHDPATTQTSISASAVTTTTTTANTTAQRDSLVCPTYDDEKVGKKLPEMINGGRLRKRIASSDNILCGTKFKLAPVSISLDKLCDDNVGDCNNDTDDNDDDNDEKDNGVVMENKNEDLCELKTISEKELQKTHMGKGGLIKRRMLGSIRGLMASTNLLHQHENEETGPGGFEDIRRYVKQGGDFCKELAAILHERAELEASYAKGLSKLSSKLTKACSKDQGGNSSGGVNEAWRNVGEEMEAAAEAHRVWGVALSEQLAKPLRVGVAEAQGRSRKAIESSVDKASKSLQEWRGIAAKSKKQSFSCARENERLQDLARIQSISQSQQNNNKTSSHHMTEKEVNKLENRRRKAEDSSRRADTEFYTVSVRAERARLEYECTVRKGAKQMELLEEERLSALKDLANVYLSHLQALAPRLQQSADRLATPVHNCSVSHDIDILKNLIRRMDSNDAATVDQLLPDFYAEHVTLAMNRERRKQALVRVLHLIRQDLERERRGREGLETLHRAFIQTPAFAADESTQNVTDKIHHMRSMLTYLEAARYKVGGALAEVEGGKKGKHPLAEHILVSRDKQGLQQSVLKMPIWAKNESFEFPDVDDDVIEEIHMTKVHDQDHQHEWIDRTAGDGNSENPPDEEDFSDFDEFSSHSEDNNNQEVDVTDITSEKNGEIIIEQCRAIYQYSANLNDELSLTPGDIITIHRKQADGWWIGECGGRTGIFPATYVQVIR
ncbi:hypothetical protein PV327_004443 [Microctonus hyperodae]|uniref:Nostrin n=1 Tax=Microctonus hyperodae TaxID=165561 RepID=A0AA39KMI1_MICHY|nr:hypothetical protein PV327_004443 [Microctonus hyperodae]